MIAYNNKWLNNLLIRKEADKAYQSACISKEEKEQVYTAYPSGLYTPNLFVRLGLFILTIIIALFTLGLFFLFFISAREEQVGGMIFFFGLILYAALEFMVNKNHYNSGVDDALLLTCPIGIICGLNILSTISWLANAIFIFILALYLFLRFTNRIMAAVTGLAFIAIVFLSFIKLGETAKALAPFAVMITAAFIFLFVQRLIKKEKSKQYRDGLLMVSITALVCFYAAGNYYVVRETSIALFNLNLQEGESMPVAWLFWIFTVTIPILYIVRGIQKKDVVFLRIGLLLIAAMVFTVRYYYHVMPIESAAVIAGILFIVLAYALIKYLEEPRHGFTYKKEDDAFFMDKVQIESLLIAQAFTGTATPTDSGTQFGGGTGGGGGATGDY